MTGTAPTALRIRRAALRLLEQEGPEAVTMRRLARSIGITPMAIYHHFDTREALLREVVDAEFGAFLDLLARMPARGDAEEQIVHALDAYLEYALSRVAMPCARGSAGGSLSLARGSAAAPEPGGDGAGAHAMRTKVPLEDRMDLHDLIARYAWALDTGDVESYLDCFFEDGWIQHEPPGLCRGRDAIRRLTEFLWYEHPFNYLGRQHRMSQVLMAPESGGARIRAFWSILQHDVFTDQNFVFGLGLWNALAAKDADGEWRLRSLEVDIWRGKDVPWVGDARAWNKRT